MLKSINYMCSNFSLVIFLLLSSWGNNGGFVNKKMIGEEFGDPQETKLGKYYNRLEERKTSLVLLRQDGGGGQIHHLMSTIL